MSSGVSGLQRETLLCRTSRYRSRKLAAPETAKVAIALTLFRIHTVEILWELSAPHRSCQKCTRLPGSGPCSFGCSFIVYLR